MIGLAASTMLGYTIYAHFIRPSFFKFLRNVLFPFAAVATSTTSAAAAAARPLIILPPGAASFPALEDPVSSAWVTRKGNSLPAAFWSSDAYRRLIWCTSPKRNPLCRNSRTLADAGLPRNNLLVSTPEGAFYIGWSGVRDGFLYYCDHTNVRRMYLELAALHYARTFPNTLPDPAVLLPDPNLTPKKQFIANMADVSSKHVVALNDDKDITARILQRNKEKALSDTLLKFTNGRSLRDTDESLMRRKLGIQLRADADPTRLVIEDATATVAHNWSPQLRALWMQRALGALSFQRGGKLADIFHTPKRMYGKKKRGDASAAAAAARPVVPVMPIVSVDMRAATSSARGFGMKYNATATTDDADRVNLTKERGMTYQEFMKARDIEKIKRMEEKKEGEKEVICGGV